MSALKRSSILVAAGSSSPTGNTDGLPTRVVTVKPDTEVPLSASYRVPSQFFVPIEYSNSDVLMAKSSLVPFTKFRASEPLTPTTTRSSHSTELIVYLPAGEP